MLPVFMLILAGLPAQAPAADGVAELPAMLLQGLVTALVMGAMLLGWSYFSGKRNMIRQLRRELRYFKTWSDREGIYRKVGLLRELNELGAPPGELEGIVLDGADLRGIDLKGCRLRGGHLNTADLQGAMLDGADLFGVEMAGANLELASLNGANLRSANLEGASMVRAEMAEADLQRANLTGVNLNKANLGRVNLHRARFAYRQAGLFQQTVHPSVEDWIRERLDEQGTYQSPDPQPDEAEGAERFE